MGETVMLRPASAAVEPAREARLLAVPAARGVACSRSEAEIGQVEGSVLIELARFVAGIDHRLQKTDVDAYLLADTSGTWGQRSSRLTLSNWNCFPPDIC